MTEFPGFCRLQSKRYFLNRHDAHSITMRKNWKYPLWAVLISFCWTASSFAQSVFRCSVNGKTFFYDRPCADTSPKGNTNNLAADRTPISEVPQNSPNYTTPYGEWRGQAQYQATENGQLLPGAHAVLNMTIAVNNAGKIAGSSLENGCKLLGVAAPFVTPASLSLDVTLSECQFAGYNRRYNGYLHLNQAQKSAGLTLNSAWIRAGSSVIYDIRATMRR